jgi:hypothetical protein
LEAGNRIYLGLKNPSHQISTNWSEPKAARSQIGLEQEKHGIGKKIEMIWKHNIVGDEGHAPLFCSSETAPGESNPIQVIGLQ